MRRSHRRRSTPGRSGVSPRRFDVLVVGAGPGGSIAALVLARAGAQVALLDKAHFPRDKACGDFIGPRGLQVLADLGVDEPPGYDVGDMVVVGPTDPSAMVRLPTGTRSVGLSSGPTSSSGPTEPPAMWRPARAW